MDARRWTSQARDHARAILTAMLWEANPQRVIRKRLRFDGTALHLPDGTSLRLAGRRVHLLAIGKAAGGMAAQAQAWGPFEDAVVVAPYDAGIPGFVCLVGDHPVPSARSVTAGERALMVARRVAEDDLLLVLLSGGASALAEVPRVPLEDLQRTTDLLLRADAPIGEINVVRRHLSALKGGGLLRAARGQVALLAISDVAGDDLAALGSGPASPDASTFEDALGVLRRRGLREAVPPSVLAHLEAGAKGAFPDTVKPGDPALARVAACVLASNEDALLAGAREAARLGYAPHVFHEALRGEARAAGRLIASNARELAGDPGGPLAWIAGGETVVRVQGLGRGGRNQETTLAAVDGLSGLEAVLACMGTDGVDGPTDAAGALADGFTRARAEALGLDAEAHLQENDAYPYFEALQDLVRTGPTGTNVRDVAVLLVRRDRGALPLAVRAEGRRHEGGAPEEGERVAQPPEVAKRRPQDE